MFSRKYARKPAQVTRTETALGVAILIVLALVGLGVFRAGDRGGTQQAVIAGAGLDRDVSMAGPMLPAQWETLQVSSEKTSASESAAGFDLAALPDIDGWKRGEVEAFRTDNLYEKINGRAEAYVAFDFQQLDCVSYQNTADEMEYVDVYVFDHGSELNTFGMYASERPPDPALIETGREGYDSAGSIYFWKGTKYVQIIPSSGSEGTLATTGALAQALEAMIADSGEPLEGLGLLPAEGQVPSTAQFILRYALSQEFLNNTFTALYDAGDGKRLRMFVTKAESPEAAKSMLAQYREYLTSYASPANLTLEGMDCASGDLVGTKELVFADGDYFAGVTEAPSDEAALSAAQRLREHFNPQGGS